MTSLARWTRATYNREAFRLSIINTYTTLMASNRDAHNKLADALTELGDKAQGIGCVMGPETRDAQLLQQWG